MIICRLLLCAQGVVRDAQHGSISIFNIMESLQSAAFPIFLQQMDVFALFERLPEDPTLYDIIFRISIGDIEIVNKAVPIDFQNKMRNRTNLHINGLVIPNPGVVMVRAHWESTVLGEYQIIAEQLPGPNVEAQQIPLGPEGSV